MLRKTLTDHLDFMAQQNKRSLRPFVDRLAAALRATGEHRVVDLCSGGGGPSPVITRLLREEHGLPARVTLTDLYPNLERFERAGRLEGEMINFCSEPVDATTVPRTLEGFRLLCNSFHHMPPDLARQILSDAVDRGVGIAVLEFVERSPIGLMQVLLGVLLMPLVAPIIQPFSLRRLLLTTIVPVAPLSALWDGMVSCLRIYSPDELRELTAGLDGYAWDIGRLRIPPTPLHLTYLIGVPGSAARAAS